jgi:hypothetical protein
MLAYLGKQKNRAEKKAKNKKKTSKPAKKRSDAVPTLKTSEKRKMKGEKI